MDEPSLDEVLEEQFAAIRAIARKMIEYEAGDPGNDPEDIDLHEQIDETLTEELREQLAVIDAILTKNVVEAKFEPTPAAKDYWRRIVRGIEARERTIAQKSE